MEQHGAVGFDPTASPPVPVATPSTRFYWDAVREHRLCLLRCGACGHYVHYPRPACDRCQSRDLAPGEISGRGTLYSYSEVVQGSHPYFAERLPYLIGIVAIDEEPEVHLPTGIVDATRADLRCDMPVEVTFREVTASLTLPYFRPVREGASR